MTTAAGGATQGAEQNMRDKALSLAALGFRVFPLHPLGKTPLQNNFPSIATSDEAAVRELWTDPLGDPLNYNIGIATGKGVVAVDYDTKNGKPGLAERDKFDGLGMPESIRMRTPSGGEHLILRTEPNLIIGSSIEKIAPGVDTRGRNSYIVAPGSIVETPEGNKAYEFITQKPVEQADFVPPFFLELLLQHSRYNDSPSDTMPLVDLDMPSAVKRAADYLTNQAPQAIEGHHGDHTTFTVAAKLQNFGLSEDFAYDLMLSLWNEQKASPPWSAEELKRKVANAFKYARDRGGSLSPEADFEAVEIDESQAQHLVNAMPADPDWPKPHLVKPFEAEDLPPRDFIFPNRFAKRTVSALVAPSGAGKTQLLVEAAVALSTFTPILGETLTPTKRRKVWLWNQEDDRTELDRRLLATLLHFGLDFEDISNNLFFDSGVDKPLLLAGKSKTGTLKPTIHVNRIIERIKQHNIDVFIADPLVEFHQGEENDNVQMAHVAGILRRIAVEADCAVIIGHHDRKPENASSTGHIGNQNAMRGASSLQGVTRAIATLYVMSKEDAKAHKIAEDQRHRYLRLDDAKNNLGFAGGKPQWFERTGQPLRFDCDSSEEVGVLRPVDLTSSRVEKIGDEERSVAKELRREADDAAYALVARALKRLYAQDNGFEAGRPARWSQVIDVLSSDEFADEAAGRSKRSWYRWMNDQRADTRNVLGGALKVRRRPGGTVLVQFKAGDDDFLA